MKTYYQTNSFNFYTIPLKTIAKPTTEVSIFVSFNLVLSEFSRIQRFSLHLNSTKSRLCKSMSILCLSMTMLSFRHSTFTRAADRVKHLITIFGFSLVGFIRSVVGYITESYRQVKLKWLLFLIVALKCKHLDSISNNLSTQRFIIFKINKIHSSKI